MPSASRSRCRTVAGVSSGTFWLSVPRSGLASTATTRSPRIDANVAPSVAVTSSCRPRPSTTATRCGSSPAAAAAPGRPGCCGGLTLGLSPTLISLNEARYSHLRQPCDGARLRLAQQRHGRQIEVRRRVVVLRRQRARRVAQRQPVRRRRGGPFRRHRLRRIAEPLLCAETRLLVRQRANPLSISSSSRRTGQLTPAYECNPTVTRLMKNRLNTIATKPTTLIQAAFLSRQPAVERACRYAA